MNLILLPEIEYDHDALLQVGHETIEANYIHNQAWHKQFTMHYVWFEGYEFPPVGPCSVLYNAFVDTSLIGAIAFMHIPKGNHIPPHWNDQDTSTFNLPLQNTNTDIHFYTGYDLVLGGEVEAKNPKTIGSFQYNCPVILSTKDVHSGSYIEEDRIVFIMNLRKDFNSVLRDHINNSLLK